MTKFSKSHPWVKFQKQCSIAYRKNKNQLQLNNSSQRIQPKKVKSKKLKRLKTPKSFATEGLKEYHNTIANIENRIREKQRRRRLQRRIINN